MSNTQASSAEGPSLRGRFLSNNNMLNSLLEGKKNNRRRRRRRGKNGYLQRTIHCSPLLFGNFDFHNLNLIVVELKLKQLPCFKRSSIIEIIAQAITSRELCNILCYKHKIKLSLAVEQFSAVEIDNDRKSQSLRQVILGLT